MPAAAELVIPVFITAAARARGAARAYAAAGRSSGKSRATKPRPVKVGTVRAGAAGAKFKANPGAGLGAHPVKASRTNANFARASSVRPTPIKAGAANANAVKASPAKPSPVKANAANARRTKADATNANAAKANASKANAKASPAKASPAKLNPARTIAAKPGSIKPRPAKAGPPNPFGKPPPPRAKRRRKRPPLTVEQTRRLLERHQRDWFRILSELQALGLTNADVARALRLRDSTIRNWKYGKEPTHARGQALLALHARLTRRRGRPPGWEVE
ncbi:MAG TPA: hypothetical protein VGN52_13925 [Burkholderiales bacterium]